MRRVVAIIILSLMSISVWAGETGLFTYEGGFFVKNGTSWKEYRPKDKPGVWATYNQYSQDDKYYYISNDNGSLAIPEKSINNFYRMEGGEWKVIYKTRVVYDHFSDSSVRLFCFPTGYFVRDGKTWRFYLPEKQSSLWATFTQYDEDDKFFYLSNSSDKMCVPKRADLQIFLWKDGKWSANYTVTEIYDHI